MPLLLVARNPPVYIRTPSLIRSSAGARCASFPSIKKSRYKRTHMPPARKKVTLPVPDQNLVREHPAIVKKELRQIFRDAFDTLGGARWLVTFVREDPQNARTFVQAIARLMPLELVGKDGGPLSVVVQMADGSRKEVDLNPRPVEGDPTPAQMRLN